MAANTTSLEKLGWVDEPNGRGTWSILSTCILTIMLCCWSSVYPNVPSRSDGEYHRLIYKLDLFAIGMLGPEFLMFLALGQWSSARASFKKFQDAGYDDWTKVHSFFADMGGFLLDAPGIDPFPIDAKQLYQLIEDGYVEYPKLDVEDINDKSKSDHMSRSIAVAQAIWFSVNCIIRASQNLFLTTFELTTASFIVVFLVTSFCWRHKPKDIARAMIVTTNTPIHAIRARYHPNPEQEWFQTPLDFLSRHEWYLSLMWRFYIQILHYLHIPIFRRPKAGRAYDRIPSDTFLYADETAEAIGVPVIILLGCVFMLAWNFEFPTPLEKLFWRVAAVYQIIFGFAAGIHVWYSRREILPNSTAHEHRPPSEKRLLRRLASKISNIHPDQDPNLYVPLGVAIPNILFCSLYVLSRVYFLTEDLIGLRRLPASAFETVSWSEYLPHW